MVGDITEELLRAKRFQRIHGSLLPSQKVRERKSPLRAYKCVMKLKMNSSSRGREGPSPVTCDHSLSSVQNAACKQGAIVTSNEFIRNINKLRHQNTASLKSIRAGSRIKPQLSLTTNAASNRISNVKYLYHADSQEQWKRVA